MNNNDEKKIGKTEYFELREKRIKLVYRILYVVVAIWIAAILNITNETLTLSIIPAYTFLLATTSLMIVKIIKYALMEFRCMKVIGSIDESLLKQTEDRYDNIWKSFSLVLSLCALIMLIHIRYPNIFSETALIWIFAVCVLYFSVLSVVEVFKNKFKDITIKILDLIGMFVGILTAYSICALLCLVTIK